MEPSTCPMSLICSVGLPSSHHMLRNIVHFLRTARGMRCIVCATVHEAGTGVVCGRCGAIPTVHLQVLEDVYPEEIWEDVYPEQATLVARWWGLCRKVTTDGEQSGDMCSICLEEFGVGVEASSMPCSHLFHSHCIDPWLQRSSLCPLCRFQLPCYSFTVQSFLR